MKTSITLSRIAVLASSLVLSPLFAAAPFSPEQQPLGYIGPIELSNTSLTGGVKAYRGWFENGAWQGDVIEYDVSVAGGLSTSINLSGTSPTQGATASNWSAFLQFDASDGDAPTYNDYWDTGRKIITSNGGVQVPFRFDTINDTQKAAIDSVAFVNGDTTSPILNFVRGDRSKEHPAGSFRTRYSLLGDVIHPKPVYVQTPNSFIPETSYTDFINNNATRAGRVYFGANDGMMHALDAATGDEVWAYIPSMLIDNLSKLASRPFAHTYYVDGDMTIIDAYFGNAWHTVLVGALGAGGKGLYALDVTSPDLTIENAPLTGGDKKFLWELTADPANNYGDDVGFIFGGATIAKLNDGKWYAITGNGFSSVRGFAKLFIVDLETGDVKRLTTGTGTALAPNGLGPPALLDVDNDGTVDVLYAGDIDGDLWKFDLSSIVKSDWHTAYKLYDGVESQPITTRPEITNHPQFGFMIMFGTGRLYTAADIIDTSTQALYGIWDKGVTPTADVKLAQIFSADHDYTSGGIGETVRTIADATAIDWNTNTGWVAELAAGDRLLTPAQLRAGRLKSTITNPNGFENWLVEVNYDDGGYASDTIFDLNQDSKLSDLDRVDGNFDNDLSDFGDIPMAWKRRNGNMSQATIARIGKGVDTLFLNYLNPPIIPPACTGDCEGGLGGGHMDVDYDTTRGGATDGHQHEYDDDVHRTYVDYFDIDPLNNGKLDGVDEVGIVATDKFVILIANADLSPGAELTIGTKTINVVEYQRMIHKALAVWNGDPTTLVYPGFGNLVYTLPQITPDFRTTFDSLAIINGGLHPTHTDCVNKDSAITKGRWRNGSLVIQLVHVDQFAGLGAGDSALDRITVQSPSDMYESVIIKGQEIVLAEDLSKPLDGDTTDPYEVYGGLYATSDAHFLYESTLFWHYKEVVVLDLLNLTNPCYGDPAWDKAREAIRNGVPKQFFDELLIKAGFVDATTGLADLPALLAQFNALEAANCKDIKEKKGGCKKKYKALAELVELSKIVEGSTGTNGGPITGLESAGTKPVVIEGAVTTGGVTSGPNFDTGRRTWIDILPQ
jgi:hypothetical protein